MEREQPSVEFDAQRVHAGTALLESHASVSNIQARVYLIPSLGLRLSRKTATARMHHLCACIWCGGHVEDMHAFR